MSQHMRSVDAAWLHMDQPGNAADIVALFRFREALTPEELRRVVEERLLPLPRFRDRVRTVLGGATWEADDRFDLDNHLERLRLPRSGPLALRAAIDRVTTEPLDPGMPLWRLLSIEGPDGEGALVAKLHHCIGDGFALVSVLLALADAPEGGRPPVSFPAAPLPDLSAAALGHALTSFARAGALAGQGLAMAGALARMIALPADPPTPLARPLSGRRRVAWTRPFPQGVARQAARARDCSVNDLLLAALAGALRAHLAALGSPLDGRSLRALVPVSMRARGPDGLGNGFGLVFVDLPVGEAGREARIEAVRTAAHRLKHSPDAAVTYGVLSGLGLLPGPAERALLSFFAAKASLVVTNVPGPRHALLLGGRQVDDLVFWVPHPSRLGLGVSILSYGGRIRIGVRADVAALADPAGLATRVEEEAAALGLPPDEAAPVS
jgi:diacylglycerol O-acyltransferase